jgi:hypothetical protein
VDVFESMDEYFPVAQTRILSSGRKMDADPALRRRQLGHDIDHQLATIMLLASLIDPDSSRP